MNPTDAPNRIELSGKTHLPTMAIVDDDPRVRELLKEEIQDEGHHVLSFESAETFLDNSALESIHLVLLDLMMPGMNGLEWHLTVGFCANCILNTQNCSIGRDQKISLSFTKQGVN